jgi:hypothetical protein
MRGCHRGRLQSELLAGLVTAVVPAGLTPVYSKLVGPIKAGAPMGVISEDQKRGSLLGLQLVEPAADDRIRGRGPGHPSGQDFSTAKQPVSPPFPIAPGSRLWEQEFSPFAVVRARLSPYHNGGPHLVQSQGSPALCVIPGRPRGL